MTNSPTRMIHGLCAISFEVLRETYRTAKPCSNINPCKADEICFSNEVPHKWPLNKAWLPIIVHVIGKVSGLPCGDPECISFQRNTTQIAPL